MRHDDGHERDPQDRRDPPKRTERRALASGRVRAGESVAEVLLRGALAEARLNRAARGAA